MRAGIAAAAACLLGLTACVSAQNPSSQSAPVTNPTPNASDLCDLFTTAQLDAALSVGFYEATRDPSSTETTVQCQWTAKDQTSLVITKVIKRGAAALYEESMDASSRTLGAVVKVDVPGAEAAFEIPSLGRTAMLVGDEYVEVSVLVPTADQADVAKIAALAAKNAKS